jgi:hypothetical protein
VVGKLKWTGEQNNNWYNPGNWVEIDLADGHESPAEYTPTICTDVIIASDAKYYPDLDAQASCNLITMEDRAMLKDSWLLTYTSASVELKLKPSERDRYVMLSAPLQDMYTGDFHFKNAAGQPQWGDFDINFFQQANPSVAGATAEANTFTASSGYVSTPLPLGTPFNLKLTSTSMNRDSVIRLPKPDMEYNAADGSSIQFGSGARANGGRFITESLMYPGGLTPLPVPANEGMALVQVVNPYMAYLKFSDFISSNSTTLNGGYYIWSGDVNDGFTGVIEGPNNRYLLTDDAVNGLSPDPDLIPPLQSFIVAKKNTAELPNVYVAQTFTTTSPAVNYTLRADNVLTGGFLRMTVKQGDAVASAALSYDLEASAAYGLRDLPAVDYDALPLSLYTVAQDDKPLMINSSDDFETGELPLGIRTASVGEAAVSFTGLDDFGYDVVLKDKLIGTEKLLTASDNTYDFTITDNGSIADRFVLDMTYTGKGITTDTDPTSPQSPKDGALIAHATDGGIMVSGLQPGTMMYVYDMEGRLVYSQHAAETQLIVPLPGGQYVVGNEGRSIKIMN